MIDKSKERFYPHFTKTDDRVYLSNNNGELLSIRWDGTDKKVHLKLKGIVTYGSQDKLDDHSLLPQEVEADDKDKSSKPDYVHISPDGKSAMAKINNDVYVATIPRYGKVPTVSVAKADKAAFPAMKLTIIGGEFANWSADSKNVHWSLGSSHFRYNVADGKQFADSLAAAKKKGGGAKKIRKEKRFFKNGYGIKMRKRKIQNLKLASLK